MDYLQPIVALVEQKIQLRVGSGYVETDWITEEWKLFSYPINTSPDTLGKVEDVHVSPSLIHRGARVRE